VSGTVIGLFGDASDAEIALNNLAEADYDSSTISVVTSGGARSRRLSDASGPLSLVGANQLPARLGALGLSEQDSGIYAERLAAGAVFIAVEAPDGSEDDAMKILASQKGELVHCLRPKAGS
jgi:hypothetical protein